MARYKHIDISPRFLAVDLQRQLLPGSFEYALNHLLDHEIDLTGFDARFCNDDTGAAAYPPAMLLKVVLFAYSQGIVSSRGIERFATQHRHKQNPDPLHDKSGKTSAKKKAATYRPEDFDYDPEQGTCTCPAGKQLYGNGTHCIHHGFAAVKFQGAQRDCVPCSHRDRCLRTPEKTRTRQVAFFHGKAVNAAESYTDKMKQRIDSPEGRIRCGGRFATVEPVFGNVRYNKGLDRFTLRGKTKVDGQWKLFCLVHNIEKLAHHGYAQ